MSVTHRLLRFFRAYLPALAIGAIVAFCGVTFVVRLHKKSSEALVPTPSDVDLVLKNYRYSENLPGSRFSLQGTELVRRGTIMLGLRSNIKKTTTLTGITGRFLSNKQELKFSAEDAEWDTSAGAPLFLNRGVSIRLGGEPLPDVERAIFNLKERRLITFGSKRKEYYLK